MANSPCPIYLFLHAARGNWRNAVYVECDDTTCRRPCCGFLMAFDREGKPALIPLDLARKLTDEQIDKSECAAVISRQKFEGFFSLWLNWLTDSLGDCPALRFMQKHPCNKFPAPFCT